MKAQTEPHWSWEGRDEAEQLEWERDLFRDVFDFQVLRVGRLEERVWELERKAR